MKYLLAICLCLFALPAFAGELTISEPVPKMLTLPLRCYEMSHAEFFRWATWVNREQRLDIVYGTEPRYIESQRYQTRHDFVYRGVNVTREVVPMRYLNPNYVAPTPLHIINPFCPPSYPQRYPPRLW
jgi:hypothetical protein